MSYFPKRPHYIGITPEKSTLKIAILSPTRKGWSVKQLKELPISSCVKPLDIFSCEAKVATAMEGREILIRPLELPLSREKELRSAMVFQASSTLPYPVEEAVLDAELISSEGGKTKFNLLAVRKSHLEKHLAWCDSLHFTPDVTLATPLALSALSTILSSSQIPQMFVHIGDHETCCTLISDGRILRSYSFSSDRSLATEMRKISLALSQGGRALLFDSVVLLGRVTDETLGVVQEATGKATIFPSAPSLSLSQEKLIEFGLAIGLAIAASKKVNFRKEGYAPTPSLEKYKKSFLFFGTGILVLSLFLGILALLSLSHQKKMIRHRFEALLFQEGKPPAQLTQSDDYLEQIKSLKEEIESRPDTFPLSPLVPTVSEFLSWLSHHPILSKEKSVTIQKLHYTYVKHPDLAHPKERYRVKVSMELTTANSQVSKLLHEALTHDQVYIDSKSELQWTTAKDGSHHLSFFLKDKTRYT